MPSRAPAVGTAKAHLHDPDLADHHNLARGRRLVIVVARPNGAASEREWTVRERTRPVIHEAPGVRLSHIR
jgi:hypothetical protein